MEVSEFARYVLNNLTRATLVNALNITTKLDTPDYYKFTEFVNNINFCIKQDLQDKKLEEEKAFILLGTSHDLLGKYKSSFNYNKKFILDDFIIKFWKVMNGEV